MAALEARVAGLEREVRRWRYAAAALGLILLVAATVAAQRPEEVPDVLRARRVEVLRSDDSVGLALDAQRNRSVLTIAAPPNDERSIMLAASEEGAGFVLMKDKEAPLFTVRAGDEGASLHMWDGRQPGEKPVCLVLQSRCHENGYAGEVALGVSRGAIGPPQQLGVYLSDTPEGNFSVRLGHRKGKRATVTVNQQSGETEIRDEDGSALWPAP